MKQRLQSERKKNYFFCIFPLAQVQFQTRMQVEVQSEKSFEEENILYSTYITVDTPTVFKAFLYPERILSMFRPEFMMCFKLK